jgi:hypothetical protein
LHQNDTIQRLNLKEYTTLQVAHDSVLDENAHLMLVLETNRKELADDRGTIVKRLDIEAQRATTAVLSGEDYLFFDFCFALIHPHQSE